jgi:uncharacterized membrane protein (UPF0127 family)
MSKWKVCIGLNKYLGLMFRWKPQGAIFMFGKESHHPIHTYFCRTLRVKWYNHKGAIVEQRIVKPWSSNIVPKNPYWFLTEEILSQ